jgi:hypothetical protein
MIDRVLKLDDASVRSLLRLPSIAGRRQKEIADEGTKLLLNLEEILIRKIRGEQQ